MEFRALRANEIDCRVATVKYTEKTKGVSLLLYKDARCDMRILDETVGSENWQREHYECKGNLFCRVGIKCKGEWIWKSDCGVESYAEKEKGESSDSFKRGCFCWGIGRELYTSPFIWVDSSHCDIKDSGRKDQYGKPIYTTFDRFSVSDIDTKNGEIVSLTIYNDTKKCTAFSWKKAPAKEKTKANRRSLNDGDEIKKDGTVFINALDEVNARIKVLAAANGMTNRALAEKILEECGMTMENADYSKILDYLNERGGRV